MKDSTRRGIRTALQLIVTLLTTGSLQGVLALLGHPVSTEAFAAISAVFLPVVTAVLNAWEDSGAIPAVLKAPASDGEDPVPDDAGYVSAGYLTGLVLAVCGVILACTVSVLLGSCVAVVGAILLFCNIDYR